MSGKPRTDDGIPAQETPPGEGSGLEVRADDAPLAQARWLQAPESRRLLVALTAGGKPARFVGGCVRDTLLNRDADSPDLDLATAEPPERVMALLERAGIRVIPTGLAHGTVTARLGDRTFEITTLRRDVETFGRHARVAFTDDFAEDAARRDFTINAMSVDPSGRLFDYFGGREDLARGRVRFVGRARERIREDYLRILRFFRFFARFGRPPADGEALSAVAAEAGGIERLSGERIREELLRLLAAPGAAESLRLMIATGVLAHILPWPVDLEAFERLVRLAPESEPLVRLAVLLRRADPGDEGVERLARRLRLSNREKEELRFLLTAPLPDFRESSETHRARAYRFGRERYLRLLALAAAVRDVPFETFAAVRGTVAAFARPEFPLRGRDLLALGVPSGPRIGALLKELERRWIASDFRLSREQLLDHARRLAAGD